MLINELYDYDGTKKMVTRCLDLTRNSNGIIVFGAGVGGYAVSAFKIKLPHRKNIMFF